MQYRNLAPAVAFDADIPFPLPLSHPNPPSRSLHLSVSSASCIFRFLPLSPTSCYQFPSMLLQVGEAPPDQVSGLYILKLEPANGSKTWVSPKATTRQPFVRGWELTGIKPFPTEINHGGSNVRPSLDLAMAVPDMFIPGAPDGFQKAGPTDWVENDVSDTNPARYKFSYSVSPHCEERTWIDLQLQRNDKGRPAYVIARRRIHAGPEADFILDVVAVLKIPDARKSRPAAVNNRPPAIMKRPSAINDFGLRSAAPPVESAPVVRVIRLRF